MTLEQFNLSDDNEQTLALCNGVCVAGRDEGEYKVLLYQLKRFYVEVFYHPGKKLITQYRGFEELDFADKYLQKINLALAF
jgi:hypothetical protein